MKLKILIAFIVLINFSFIQSGTFKLLALGDTGQVDDWWQQNQIMRISNLIYDLKTTSEDTKKHIESYASEILSNMNKDPLNVEDGRSPYQVFKNFGSFYTCNILDHGMDSIVLLGDGIYTEHKAKGKILSSSFKSRTETFVPEDDIPETLDVTTAKDYYFNLGSAFGRVTEILDKRTLYAAKKLGEILVAPTPNPDPQKPPCFSGDPKHIIVIPGNHSFDIDQPLEEVLVASQFEKVEPNVPFLSQEKDKDNKVIANFLDANLMQLACLDKGRFLLPEQQTTDILGDTSLDNVLYKNCIKGEGGSRTLKNPKDAREYLALLVARLVELKNKPGHWRVFRTHNPLFNPEVDYNAALQLSLKYKCNGKDLSTIWSIAITDKVKCDYDNTMTNISLMSVFQNAGIDFFLVSHFHAAMVISAPYSPTYPIGLFNGDPSGLRCFDRFSDFFGLVDSNSTVERTVNPPPVDISASCDINFTGENKIYLQPAGSPQKFYLSFVIGNSGRYLDPIPLDTYSNGDIIWARSSSVQYIDQQVKDLEKREQPYVFSSKDVAKSNIEQMWNKIRDNSQPKFGYTLLTFSETNVIVEFYEINGGQKKVTNRFNLIRGQPENGKVQKIEKMNPKVIPPKPTKPKKSNKKLLKKVK